MDWDALNLPLYISNRSDSENRILQFLLIRTFLTWVRTDFDYSKNN